jgi:type II secretion system protein G
MKCWGFTLIELLIVVAIIAILAAIAVPNFLEAQARSKVAREKAEMRMIDVALEAYAVDNNEYPPWTERLGTRIHPCSWRFAWLTTPIAYLTSIPMDPFALKREWDETDNGRPNWDTYDLVTQRAQSDDQWTHGHAWRLSGFGPDYVNQYAGGRTSFNGVSLGSAYTVFPNYIYDPTNGTVSWGDVVRVGGRVPITDPNVQYHPIERLQ